MTTDYHTPVTEGAAANAATFNAPLGELDAALVYLQEILTELEELELLSMMSMRSAQPAPEPAAKPTVKRSKKTTKK